MIMTPISTVLCLIYVSSILARHTRRMTLFGRLRSTSKKMRYDSLKVSNIRLYPFLLWNRHQFSIESQSDFCTGACCQSFDKIFFFPYLTHISLHFQNFCLENKLLNFQTIGNSGGYVWVPNFCKFCPVSNLQPLGFASRPQIFSTIFSTH